MSDAGFIFELILLARYDRRIQYGSKQLIFWLTKQVNELYLQVV